MLHLADRPAIGASLISILRKAAVVIGKVRKKNYRWLAVRMNRCRLVVCSIFERGTENLWHLVV